MTPAGIMVLATAIACAVPCGVLGCFLVLRRMSLIGDAITHAILPGLVIAFALTGSRAVGPMLLGAGAMGLLTAFLAAAISRRGRVDEGASLGVVFSAMFALGVIMLNIYGGNVDLDATCVLYGVIELVPFDTRQFLGLTLPRALIALLLIGVPVLITVALLFKELKIVCFDAALATTLGINAAAVHYGLLAAVAAVSVVSFEAVGSILVVAMLVAPAATAQLLTDRLGRMVILSAIIAAADAVIGYFLAVWTDSSVAGMMAAAAGAVFIIAAIVAPGHGIIAKALRLANLRIRIAEEDALGALFRAAESGSATALAAPDSWTRRIALWRLARRRAIERSPAGPRLTDRGRRAGAAIIRAHRLWESYLARTTDLPLDHLHGPSERIEHFLSDEIQAELARDAGTRHDDPHGKPIPPR